MKRLIKKSKGIVKGAPSGFVVSLMVHAAAFLLAGMLVVFTVTQKEEKKFVPPKPVDRPKMKLKKPQVKVKKTAKPKATTRIVTKVKRASMPDIQLPEMSGMADGLVGGVGGFEIMPDLNEVTLFGGGQTIGNDFVGTFYDFKRDRLGKPVQMDPDTYRQLLKQFIIKGWRTSVFSRYYRSPRKLYTTTFAVPPVQSALAPEAFGESDTIGYCWAAHYKGQLVPLLGHGRRCNDGSGGWQGCAQRLLARGYGGLFHNGLAQQLGRFAEISSGKQSFRGGRLD